MFLWPSVNFVISFSVLHLSPNIIPFLFIYSKSPSFVQSVPLTTLRIDPSALSLSARKICELSSYPSSPDGQDGMFLRADRVLN
jgi:hypothetical protein